MGQLILLDRVAQVRGQLGVFTLRWPGPRFGGTCGLIECGGQLLRLFCQDHAGGVASPAGSRFGPDLCSAQRCWSMTPRAALEAAPCVGVRSSKPPPLGSYPGGLSGLVQQGLSAAKSGFGWDTRLVLAPDSACRPAPVGCSLAAQLFALIPLSAAAFCPAWPVLRGTCSCAVPEQGCCLCRC